MAFYDDHFGIVYLYEDEIGLWLFLTLKLSLHLFVYPESQQVLHHHHRHRPYLPISGAISQQDLIITFLNHFQMLTSLIELY